MLWVFANDAHYTLAVYHLAFVAHFFYRRPNFHCFYPALFIPIRDPSAFQIIRR